MCPFQTDENGVLVAVHLTPKASHAAVGGTAETVDGGRALKVKVTAAPEKGKANAALLKLLAKEWRIAPSRLSLVSGDRDRRKRILVQGDPAERMKELETWLAARDG